MNEHRIKYRVWDKATSVMMPVSNINFGDDGASRAIVVDSPNEWYVPCVAGDSCVLMQYTGLKDKHGTDIYEGDVVVQPGYKWFDDGVPNYRDSVEWIYSQWQVVAHCVNPNKRGISDGMNGGLNDEGVEEDGVSGWEIIGNIYQHPHLLGPS